MLNVRTGDINGFVMRLLISAILLYKVLVQYYIQINGLFLVMGLILIFTVFVDCGGHLGFFLACNSKTLKMILIYCIFSILFGSFLSPNLWNHISWSVTVIEFLGIGMCICYYGTTRNSLDFLINDYCVIYGVLVLCFLLNPVVVNSKEGLRYSISTELNPNALALFISLFVWGILYKTSRKKINLVVGFIICTVALYGIFLTGSRKGILSAIIIIVFCILFVYLKNGNGFIRFLIIAIVVGIALYYLLPYFMNSSLFNRMTNLGDQSTKSRIEMYIIGFEYLKKAPISGIGFGGFNYFYGLYSHSSIVEVFVSSGIPLGILYFSSFGVLIKDLLSKKRLLKENEQWLENSVIDYKMSMILLFTIVISFFYIIHIYELTSYYSLAIIMMFISKEYD